MKTILVPTDYSKEARNAFTYALEFARIAKANIVLLHAFHQPISVSDATRIEDAISALEKEKNNILQEYAAEIKEEICRNFSLQFTSTLGADLPGNQDEAPKAGTLTKSGYHFVEPDTRVPEIAAVKIKCVCKLGWAAEEILRAADTYKTNLVVMSMRGAGAVSQAFLGSTVSAVIGACQVPVLALPDKPVFKVLKSFVFATDLSKLPNNAILGTLREWVKLFKTDLQILHLYRQNDWRKEKEKSVVGLDAIDKELTDITYKVYFEQQEDVAQGIQEFAQGHQADLLVLVPKQHTFLEKLFQKTVTGQLISKPFKPLLALPYQSKKGAVLNKPELEKAQK